MSAKKRGECYECGVREGELHKLGCQHEQCSKCGRQLVSCSCYTEYSPPPADSERLPYVHYPNICARCGKVEPLLFMVPDDEWEYYMQPDKRDEIICPDCYIAIRDWTDKYSGKSRGKPN